MDPSRTFRTFVLLCALALAPLHALAQGLTDPIPQPVPQGNFTVRLAAVARGLIAPNWGTSAPGLPNHLFVTDQDGVLWAVNLNTGAKSMFLNLRARVFAAGERGLLGVAFHPGFARNGLFYTYTSERAAGAANFSTLPAGVSPDHQSVIAEWQARVPGNPGMGADPASRRVLLRIDQPQPNHNAGALNIGPDDMLYISLGDGGSADDQGVGHSPQGNGQDPSNVLGTILRIDPDGNNAVSGRYGVPPDNPFVTLRPGLRPGGAAGCRRDGFCDEIFAYGFRNPFRFSFDRARGHLYAGDVGQNAIEEVDVVRKGENYGWRIKEGSFCFNPNGTGPGFVTAGVCGPASLIDPVAEYDHGEGLAVIGGFVYRGSAIPALRGRYVFGDFVRPGTTSGRLFFLNTRNIVQQGGILTSALSELRLAGRASLGLFLLGFGQDASGELYVLANATAGPFPNAAGRRTGVVFKIVPP